MRMLLFFDLPTLTYSQRKSYQKFHKFLIKSGYIMMQESVYCKLALNSSIVKSEKLKLEKNKPEEGLIQMLVVTEKQFSQMEYIIGNKQSQIEDSEKRIIII